MTRREKFWYLIGPVIMSFTYAATFPIISVYFYSLVSPRVLAISNIIGTGLSAVVNWTIPMDNMKELYRKNFIWIVLLDVTVFCIVSFTGYEYPEVRFIGFSILNAVSTCLWVMVMRNLANRIIEDGDDRTDFDALNRCTELWACFFGAIFAVTFTEIPVEYCIAAQCFANLTMGATDLYTFKILKRAYETSPNTEDKDS